MIIKNNRTFFRNHECKHFPCHARPAEDSFNCLFCYCPLYSMGDKCGGHFKFSGDKSAKDCSDCYLPHIPEYYDTILSKLKQSGGVNHETAPKITNK